MADPARMHGCLVEKDLRTFPRKEFFTTEITESTELLGFSACSVVNYVSNGRVFSGAVRFDFARSYSS
jgi:hypothetical protein